MKVANALFLGGCAVLLLPPLLEPAYADDSGALQEIVVTAQHRSESVQKVPISIAVVDFSDTEKLGVTDTTQLAMTVPSLEISHQLNAQSIFMRGVGTIANPGNEGAIATYIDGAYITGFAATLTSLANIDRVEVLKGPQGTLFGRNATGGVINIWTRDPAQQSALDASVGYANYNTTSASLFGTGGLTDTVAGSLSLYGRHQENGWGHDLTTGQKISYGSEYNARGKLLWTPDDVTKVRLIVDRAWQNYDYGLNPAVLQGTITTGLGTYEGRYNSVGNNSLSGGADRHDQYSNGATLTADRDSAGAHFTSISAYREYQEHFWFDQDMGPVNVVSPYFLDSVRQFTQEIRLSSPDGAQLFGRSWKWMLGGFYLHKNEGVTPLEIAGGAAGGLQSFQIFHRALTKSYAGFVDSTYEFIPKTNLTLGVRYTSEKTTDDSYSVAVAPPPFVIPGALLSASASKPTYRAVIDHSFTDDVMAYVSQSRGFKSGGFALLNAAAVPPVKPEILNATQVGLKSQWLNRKLQVNFEAFNYNYSNLQISKFVTGGSVFVNAAAARIRGAEFEVLADPVEHLTLRSSVNYLHGRYQSFAGAPMYLRNPAVCNLAADSGGVELPGAPTPGVTVCGFDAAGKPTVRSPQWSGNVGADYKIPTTVGSFDVAANLYYTASFNWDPDGLHPEPSYALLNSSLTWTAPSGRWDAQVYCENCTNKAYDSEEFGIAVGLGVSPGNPATYGFRVGMHL